MPTCLSVSCADATECSLVGGCVQRRFPQASRIGEVSGLRDDAPALNGTKPRPSRDPKFIKRRRKPLRP
jgi:hypothetical protein